MVAPATVAAPDGLAEREVEAELVGEPGDLAVVRIAAVEGGLIAKGGGHVMQCMREHQDQLSQIGDARLTRIMLQVSVGYEANGGVKGEVGGHGGVAIRVEGQPAHVHEGQHGKQEPALVFEMVGLLVLRQNIVW